MRGINKAIIVGRLGADPDVRYTQAGAAVTQLSVATSEAWTDKATGQRQERTEWHRITLFGRLAEVAGEYLKKGSACYVEGALRTDRWTDKDGIERFSTKIVATELQLLGGRSSGDHLPASAPEQALQHASTHPPRGGARPAPRVPAPASEAMTAAAQPDPDDDIPF